MKIFHRKFSSFQALILQTFSVFLRGNHDTAGPRLSVNFLPSVLVQEALLKRTLHQRAGMVG